MKVLVVGAGNIRITFLNRLLNGLAEKNVEVILATGNCRKIKSTFDAAVDCLWTPSCRGHYFFRLINAIFLFFSSIISKRRIWLLSQVSMADSARDKMIAFFHYAPFCSGDWDVIYFPWNSSAISYSGLFELGIPTVVSCRGSQINIRPNLPNQESFVDGLKQTLKMATAVHCVSADIQQEATKYGLNVKKSTIIHPAVDPTFFIPTTSARQIDRIKLITTGSLIWRKGYEYMLLAVKKLIDSGVKAELNILGEGIMRSAIIFTIKDLGLDNFVHLHGRVSPEEVLSHLQKSDVFLLSSLSEGVSNAVLEAMSCAIPIVTTDCGGMQEAVRDGVEGFVVLLRDPESMAHALLKLTNDPALCDKMGAAARTRVIKQFNLENQINAFISMFKSILDS